MALEFAPLLQANQAMVFSLALRFLRQREAAEELAQDVFLQLFQNLNRIQSEAHATWWLRRAICHRSIDEMRRLKLRPRVGLESAPDPAAPAAEPDWLENQRVKKMVDALPARARMVIALRYQEDMDPAEIAALLEMPVSTVKSHLHRSLAVLRSRLTRVTPAPARIATTGLVCL